MGRYAILAALLLSLPARADRYALLVGIKEYDGAELTPLDYTENDAEGLGKVLSRAGYKRVVLMTQRSAGDDKTLLPTGKNIRREM
ncbi:MAG: caspase family protein, partial [Gemmataceae bacterium]|nr:caspase family protein [Gemmataceae bacterium]